MARISSLLLFMAERYSRIRVLSLSEQLCWGAQDLQKLVEEPQAQVPPGTDCIKKHLSHLLGRSPAEGSTL